MGPLATLAASLLAAQAASPAPLALPTPESRVGWEEMLAEADGRIFIDPASVRRDGAIVRFHIRMLLAEELDGARQMFIRHVMDCARRTIGYEAGAAYDAEAQLIRSREDAPWEVELGPIPPGGAEEIFHQRLCPGNGGA